MLIKKDTKVQKKNVVFLQSLCFKDRGIISNFVISKKCFMPFNKGIKYIMKIMDIYVTRSFS